MTRRLSPRRFQDRPGLCVGLRPAAIAAAVLAVTAFSGHAQAAPGQARPPAISPASEQGADMIDYVVRPGDTLSRIGQTLFLQPEDWRRVQIINRVTDPHRLRIGSTLRIPAAFLRTTTVAARLAGFQGQVTIGRASGRLEPRLNQSLAEGDVIETGPNAFARLALSNGSAVSLPSNTRLRIDRLRVSVLDGTLDQVFTVLQGRAESRVSSLRGASGYTVRTPVSVSAVRGTVFRTGFDLDTAEAKSEVLEGAVAVEAGGEAALVAPGFGSIMNASGVRVAPLPAAAYLTDPDRPQGASEVSFDIVPVPGAASYRAVLASDSSLADILAASESAPGAARVTFGDLPDGFHVLAVSAVSAEGLEGPRSVYDFLRARNDLRDLTAEPRAAAQTVRGGAGSYLFQWVSEGAATPRYRFQLAQATGGSAEPTLLVDREGLEDARIVVPDLKPGTYSWRVRVARTVQGQLVDAWSTPQTLTIGR